MSERIKEHLNLAIARELQVSIQYLWQHVVVRGVKGQVVGDKMREIGITEMKHAESIAERLDYLGGIPTTKPNPIQIGEDWKEMVELNIKAEEEAISLYKEIIKIAWEEGDVTTRTLFEGILADEEEHHDYFARVKD
jgi:bacterioferritin